MKRMMIFLCGLFSAVVFTNIFANNCIPVDLAYTKNVVLLNTRVAKSAVYVLSNTSLKPLWLNHEKQNPGAGAGFASQLFPKKWSALLITQKAFSVSCQVSTPGGMTAVPCRSVLKICQFQGLHLTKSGDYWVAESVTHPVMMKKIASL